MMEFCEPCKPCELCVAPGGEVIYQHPKFRIVLVDDANYPGFCRVIWNMHVKEMTDLPADERALLMQAVWQVEAAMREAMCPDKINLASLGNVTPHLHWHVIPRFLNDTHFPNPVWAEAKRGPGVADILTRTALLMALREAIVRHIGRP